MEDREDIRSYLHEWVDQFEGDYYSYDVYGTPVTVNVDRETVEKLIDISADLVDTVVAAKEDLTTAEYETLEAEQKKLHGDDTWLLYTVLEAKEKKRLWARYEPFIDRLTDLGPRDIPKGSASYLLMVKPNLEQLVYATIRHVDDVEENYVRLAYTFFILALAKGWGEGFGWKRREDGGWMWKAED